MTITSQATPPALCQFFCDKCGIEELNHGLQTCSLCGGAFRRENPRSAHSPTPWIASIFKPKGAADGPAYGQVIGPKIVLIDHSWQFAPEDAAFIAKACNSHNELLEALKTAMATFNIPTHLEEYRRVKALCEHAIAKASPSA